MLRSPFVVSRPDVDNFRLMLLIFPLSMHVNVTASDECLEAEGFCGVAHCKNGYMADMAV